MPEPAARLGDKTNHLGALTGPGVMTVLIGGMPAANLMTMHACALPVNPPHPPTKVMSGSTTVFIGGQPAARVKDVTGCGAQIMMGCLTVLIGG